VGTIFKFALGVVAILVIWRLAGGNLDNVVGVIENIFYVVADALNSIAEKIANALGGVIGSGGESSTES
jgi:hypothetical protein